MAYPEVIALDTLDLSNPIPARGLVPGSFVAPTFARASSAYNPETAVEVANNVPRYVDVMSSVAPTFARASVAYKQDGTQVASGAPRYESGKYGTGIMVEEGTTNLLSLNQSTVAETTGYISVAAAPINRVLTEGWDGGASLKVDSTGSSGQGFRTTNVPASPSTVYTVSAWVRGRAGDALAIQLGERNGAGTFIGSTRVAFVATGNLQRVIATRTLGATAGFLDLSVQTDASLTTTFYVSGMQAEQKAYATSWQIGGTARAAETLMVPSSGLMNTAAGTVEIWSYLDATSLREDGIHNGLFSAEVPGGLLLTHSPGNIWRFEAGASVGTTPDSATPAGWHLFSMTWGGGTSKLYIDGVLKVTLPSQPASFSDTIVVGSRPAGNQHLNARYDDLRISNRARTAAEIAATYASAGQAPADHATTYKLPLDNALTPSTPWGQAIMVEEGTTNLMTAAQSDVTDLTGFIARVNCTIARSTGSPWRAGAASLEVTATAAGDCEGSTLEGVGGRPILPSTAYTVSGFILSSVSRDARIMCRQYDSAGTLISTTSAAAVSSTSKFTRQTHSFTSHASAAYALVSLYVIAPAAGEKHWVGGLQLEAKSYATSWQVGGTPRDGEILRPPTTPIAAAGGTIEAWMHITDYAKLAGIKNLIDVRSSGNSIVVNIRKDSGGGFVWRVENDTLATVADASMPNGWHHFAVTWGARRAAYLDGVLVGAPTIGVLTRIPDTVFGLGISAPSSGASGHIGSFIDDLRISNRPRTAGEIAAIAASGSPAPMDRWTTYKRRFDGSLTA